MADERRYPFEWDGTKEFHDEFFRNYRGRYSQFWVNNWALIPELPTSFDNANSIYELISWLQRAFKNLLDDFMSLENELEEFKNALTELLEQLIPYVIRKYIDSPEFEKKLREKLDKYFNDIIKPYIDSKINELKTYIDNKLDGFENRLNEFQKMLDNLLQELNNIKNRLDNLERALQDNQRYNQALEKIISNLENSGAWAGGLNGDFNPNRNIATGNINLFGGTIDGASFIRTNNGQSENDISVGV